MTLFIFSSVGTSGVRILGYLEWNRRDRVIVASALAIGLGVSLVPDWFTYVMPTSNNETAQGFYDSISTIVETGYLMAGIIAIILNWILPKDLPEVFGSANDSLSGHSRLYRDQQEEEKKSVVHEIEDIEDSASKYV